MIISGKFVAERLSSVSSAEKRNLHGKKLKANCEVETVETRWITTQDTDLYLRGIEDVIPQ
jgi:hypothetical protein